MQNNIVRRGLYLERLLVAFASGLFLTLPLYFIKGGQSEVFFGKIYAIGAVGTIFCVAFSAIIIKKLGLANTAPIGSLLFSIGSLNPGSSSWNRNDMALTGIQPIRNICN